MMDGSLLGQRVVIEKAERSDIGCPLDLEMLQYMLGEIVNNKTH